MMRSRVPNHIQAVPESASERAVQIQTVANPAGSVVPEPLDAAGEGRVGGRTDGQSSRLAGSRLPALCAPGRLPIPFVASAASSGPRWSQDVVVVTVVLIGWGHPRLRDGHLGLLLLLHAAA